ncbi:hypothetical protein PG994_014098 [Apiospora phragmitis]|uniref:Rhodopsin domain-containing protein n=1 Tax=Apiospora phragmitis TaxID=2905665 RepID=A0ABR1T4X2_9PEZI
MDPNEDRGPQLLAVVIAFLITATAANAMRCYTRIGIVKAFGIDDWTMLIAYVFFTLFCACTIAGIHYGTGRHEDALLAVNRARARKFWWFCYTWYGATMMFSKISIGVFILRVTTNRYHIWTVWAIMVLTAGVCSGFIVATMFHCAPINDFWGSPQSAGRSSCIDGRVMRDLAYAYSAGTLLIDLTLVVLPLMIVWKLKMSLKTKLGLSVLIFSGLVASVGVAVRFAYLDDFTAPDFLFDTLDVVIWSAVESGLAVTAGSLATLKPLFRLMSRNFGMRTAAATDGRYAVAVLPSPGLIASSTVAPEKHNPAAAVLRLSFSSSRKTSLRDSLLTTASPGLRNQDRGIHRNRPGITGEMLGHYELPARPACIAPTLPRFGTGTWRFSRQDMDDLEKGTAQNRRVDTCHPQRTFMF